MPRRALPTNLVRWSGAIGLLATALTVSTVRADKSKPATLSPSVLLFHKRHHDDGPGQVARIARAGFKRLQVVVTLYVRIDEQGRILEFGRKSGRTFVQFDDKQRAAFREALAETFRSAAEHDMEIAVVAHLNSAGPVHDWRNNFVFDPLVEYRGYTYGQAMLQPIVEALRTTPLAKKEVDFAVAGEMGRSVFDHPSSYTTLLRQLRANARLPRLRLGVSLNFTHVAGEGRDPAPVPPETNRLPAAQALFDACDFLGMSNYRWFEPPPQPGQFRQAVDAMLDELKKHGVLWDAAKPVHFTEIGIGGGMPGRRVATTPREAARTPWEGFGPRQPNPWNDPSLRKLRREYHDALLKFLASQSKRPRVSSAYLWSEGSWDPIGTLDAGFEDGAILQQIHAQQAR